MLCNFLWSLLQKRMIYFKYRKLTIDLTGLGPGIEQSFPLNARNEALHTSQMDDFYHADDFLVLRDELVALFRYSRMNFAVIKHLHRHNFVRITDYIIEHRDHYPELWPLILDKINSLNIHMAIYHNRI
jgi:hypothetical protein